MTKTPTLPKFDLDGIVAMHKANIETFVAAQKVLSDAAQAIAQLQYGLVEETFKNAQAFLRFDAKAKPEAVIADLKAQADRIVAVAKEEFDLGVKANNEVAQMITKRVAANIDGLKGMAAA
jgi:hypothetical protein